MASFSSKRRDMGTRQRTRLFVLAACISLFSALLAFHQMPESLNWLHYDHTQQFSSLPASDDLAIIEIDDKSLDTLGHWPWPRSTHARLIEVLNGAAPQTIVFDVLFPSADTENRTSDAAFARAIQRNGKVILPMYFEALGTQGVVVESPPYQKFHEAALAIGHIHFETDTDGVVRGVALKQGVNRAYWPHLALALTIQQTTHNDANIPGMRSPAGEVEASAISLQKDFYNLIPMPARSQGIRHFSYSDVLQGKVDTQLFRDKIVFIGATATGLGDVLATPVGSMHGVELNAWTFQALRHAHMIQSISPLLMALATFALVLVLLLVLGKLSPKLFLAGSVLAVCSIAIASAIVLLHGHIWMPPAAAILGLALFFPLWSWLRAESMLRYLREEIADLAERVQPANQPGEQAQAARSFLQQLGLIDNANLRITESGREALNCLATAPAWQGDEDFWDRQLRQYVHTPTSSTSPTGFDLITRTLDQLNTAKEQDRKNRQLIEQSLSGLQDAVCIADLCGQITYTNQHFRQWFLSGERIEHIPDLLSTLTTLRLKSGLSWPAALRNLYLGEHTFYDEVDYRHQEGINTETKPQFLCQISLVSTGGVHRDTLIIAFTDITQLKAAEQARAEALSFLSHDLRAPMVSVLAILERHASHTSIPAEDRGNIEALVRKNLDYAEAFLQLSKAESLPDSAREPSDLHAVLDAAHAQALALATTRSLNIIVERCREDAWVLGDISLLERAVNNLVSNAIKFSPSGATVTLTLSRSEDTLHIAIIDEGPGISEEDQAHLFKRFSRLGDTSTHGIGLGLHFVATVAAKHHGQVAINSAPGKGARFTLQLPALSEQELDAFFADQ